MAKYQITLIEKMSCILTTCFLLSIVLSTHAEFVKKTYIIHMDQSAKPDIFSSHQEWYSSKVKSVLSKSVEAEIDSSEEERIIYSYNTAFHGMAAKLSTEEAKRLESEAGVVAIFPDTKYQLHTTRSPYFLGLEPIQNTNRSWSEKLANHDVIVGVLDTGIWPESESFIDTGLKPVPSHWKGACETGRGFRKHHCNKKIVGARIFYHGYEAATGRIDEQADYKSPRDQDGHGTHTAATVAGSPVHGANLLGYAYGTARGMAPGARIAAYKVCWTGGCFSSDILSAVDTAVADGVDVLSISLGGGVSSYSHDSLSVASFGAMEKGVFVSCSAGNSGPDPVSLTNVSPWITTVGASTMDRDFPADVSLGNGRKFSGASIYKGKSTLSVRKQYPLVYMGSNSSSPDPRSLCLEGTLDRRTVTGKIVICDRGISPRVQKGQVVKNAGGVGMILTNTAANGEELVADCHLLPAVAVGEKEGKDIKQYVLTTKKATATLAFHNTRLGIRPSPIVAAFSSRGPSLLTLEILKPDIVAPGVNILAAWSGLTGPSSLPCETMASSSSPPQSKSKFSVYQNPNLSAVLTSNSLQPSNHTLISIFSFFSASAFAFLAIIFRENGFVDIFKFQWVSSYTAYWVVKTLQILLGIVCIGTMLALFKVMFLRKTRYGGGVVAPMVASSSNKVDKNQMCLTKHQLELLGVKPKVDLVQPESLKKPPKSKPQPGSSELLVPLHQPLSSPSRRVDADGSNLNRSASGRSIGNLSRSPGSATFYLSPGVVSPAQSTAGRESVVSSPWSNRRASSANKITSEEELEQFLAEVDERISESAGKLSTPPPSVPGFGIASPSTVTGSASNSGIKRHTPLRPVRMSPGSQKFKTPPKKGEGGDLPPPMSMEEAVEAFDHLGVYPQIEQWCDGLRQWFSSVLLNPLLHKIETSHVQVMNTAAKLGISITVNQVGNDTLSTGTPSTSSSIDKTQDWQPSVILSEDGLLHQLHSTLVQAIEASKSNSFVPNMQQSPQQGPLVPVMQDCVDAIIEHQRLQALVKGEWVKGLLPQSSVRADYTVQRIRELAEGTCLKNYEYLGSGEVYDKKNKKWTLELPSDSHLLLYLFCAFLEHPKWMLHVDATSYAGAQSSKNPLFLGVLPPKDRFPEKYISVVSSVPSVLHPGACILVVGKQGPPIFALYWDKKLQLSLQGRTALWDSILILCHKIKVGYGGIVRGMHLGASALSILPVMETESED